MALAVSMCLLLQRLLIFMQLRDEPEIRLRDPPFRFYERHCLSGRPAIKRHQKGTHDTRAAADPLYAMYEHIRLGVPERLADESCG
jgi:hypothetical protein